MLKIKNNIDLKELEKYGFEADDDNEWYYYDIDARTNLFVKPISRTIIFRVYNETLTRDIDNLTVLYDLIKDGLVEKVDDNND